MLSLPQFLRRLFRRQQSPEERTAASARSSARRYWRQKVDETDHPPQKVGAAESKADIDAQKSAREYWQREVADEKERRGTPDGPGRR
jgi:hypothetical protein